MKGSLCIAVDLGAGSGRVFLCGVGTNELLLEEVRRFQYPPSRRDGHLRWNLLEIFGEIKKGLSEASKIARELGRQVQSIGVDSWGVDYGLIDAEEKLLEDPVCYRDERTQGIMERVFEQVSREEIFNRTGVQFLVFNTLFQLYAHRQEGMTNRAAHLLLIPDLINLFLTGRVATEYTNATTTQMVNARTGAWDRELLERLNLPASLLAEIVPAGTNLGLLKDALAKELALEGVSVVAPATHDTGSAVAGAPLRDGWAYISSGTWSLVGVERESVLINSDVARHNFTNEGGAFGTVRFLKNVMGLWIFESCRREWKELGLDVGYDNLLREVAQIEGCQGLIFPDDARFFNPPKMIDAVASYLAESNQRSAQHPPTITKIILDSLALRYASVLRSIESLTGEKISGVQVIGGGSRNDYLNQATANATGLNVLAGPVEATVTGNLLVQSIASGRFASLQDARRHVSENVRLEKFTPQASSTWEEASRRYAELEARAIGLKQAV
ncbi:MAG TPA: rhamnulokinase family protein [Pyrinomonadaceae bacterium]|nr:rhamnulokinase family protein [Pyrinomonadaceae bacterium]